MTTAELHASVIRDVSSFFNDDDAMVEIKRFIGTLKKKRKQAAIAKNKEAFKAQFKRDIKEALEELRLAEKGKIELMTMDDLYAELENDK